jgi:hypothetical protein
MRSDRGSLTKMVRTGTQLKTMPTRVTTDGAADSALAAEIPEIGVNDPGGIKSDTPLAT